ncbi:MAG TPA: Usg family protein [Candidatus Nitrosotenuis sp.]|jgi:uncharacterized protein Usg|nr:Usg family protein [Candidatus Nitrosotenuis sp.]
MAQFRTLLEDFRLTTAEILYHLPDYPELLQTFLWQDYDLPPQYPKLTHFLEFWNRSLDGKVHSVRVAYADPLQSGSWRSAQFDGYLH